MPQENKGFLDFKEYLLASNTKIETIEDKLDWIFRSFDADDNGTITASEIREIVIYLFKVANIEDEEDLLEACISDIKYLTYIETLILVFIWPNDCNIRKALDVDRDRKITKEEFIKNAANSKFLKSMMKNLK